MYVTKGTLFAVPFDVDGLSVHGTPTPVLAPIAYSNALGFAQIDFSGTGTVVYRSGGTGGQVTVQWLDSGGKTEPLLAKPGFYLRPRLSPVGSQLAIDVTDGANQDIWTYDWQRGAMTRLTFGGSNQNQVWSPDSRYLVFGGTGISWTRPDAGGRPQPLTKSNNIQFPYSFAPDGKRLAFFEANPGFGYDIWTMPIENGNAGLRGGTPEPFLQTPFDERNPAFSPDGRWLAYASNESGIFQIYVRAFPQTGSKWQVSTDGGVLPVWSRNEHQLFFRTEDQRVMVATYAVKGESFVPYRPTVWSERRIADVGATILNYDLAPDGKRIVALMSAEDQAEPQARNQVTLLMNFFDELRRRVPTGK